MDSVHDVFRRTLLPTAFEKSDKGPNMEFTFSGVEGTLTLHQAEGRITATSNGDEMIAKVLAAARTMAASDPQLEFSVTDGTDTVKQKLKQLMHENGLKVTGYTPPPAEIGGGAGFSR
jgi:hypothetical protein